MLELMFWIGVITGFGYPLYAMINYLLRADLKLTQENLDVTNPPQGGSGVPSLPTQPEIKLIEACDKGTFKKVGECVYVTTEYYTVSGVKRSFDKYWTKFEDGQADYELIKNRKE
jgi:hypothetical protein